MTALIHALTAYQQTQPVAPQGNPIGYFLRPHHRDLLSDDHPAAEQTAEGTSGDGRNPRKGQPGRNGRWIPRDRARDQRGERCRRSGDRRQGPRGGQPEQYLESPEEGLNWMGAMPIRIYGDPVLRQWAGKPLIRWSVRRHGGSPPRRHTGRRRPPRRRRQTRRSSADRALRAVMSFGTH